MRRAQPERVIELAYQAYTEPTLEQVVERLWAAGISDAVVVAAFLSPGGRHIKQDLPDQVSAAAARYPGVRLRLVEGALGADAGVVEALARAAFLAAGALTPSGGAL
jgi:sirohydrochlorin ferrochelatase